MTAVTTLPQVNLASSGLMLPPAASQESAITSVATKTISETLRINEKDIKTSNWTIALGALAVTITALAISTLQPLVIASTLPMAAVLAFLARGSSFDASQKREHARFLNDRLAVSQKIEELERDNKPLLDEITNLKITTPSVEETQKVRYDRACAEAQNLIGLKNKLTTALFEIVKTPSQLMEIHEIQNIRSRLEDDHSHLSLTLSSNDKTREATFVALYNSLLNNWRDLHAAVETLKTTRQQTIESVKRARFANQFSR